MPKFESSYRVIYEQSPDAIAPVEVSNCCRTAQMNTDINLEM
jgi:hypothetical protein